MIWRFSKAGTVASGDRIERLQGQTDGEWAETLSKAKEEQGYQISSGAFLKIFILVVGWAFTLTALVAFSATMVVCLCDPREKKPELTAYERLAIASNEDNYDFDPSGNSTERLDTDNGV